MCTRDYERIRLHRNSEQLRASCGALSPESRGPVPRWRSQLASDTCHQVSPRAVPSSKRQEQSSGRLRTASIARVSPRCRFHVCPRSPRASPAVKSPNRHEVCNSSRRRLVNQRSNLARNPLPPPPVTKENRPIKSSTLANAAIGNTSTVARPDPWRL